MKRDFRLTLSAEWAEQNAPSYWNLASYNAPRGYPVKVRPGWNGITRKLIVSSAAADCILHSAARIRVRKFYGVLIKLCRTDSVCAGVFFNQFGVDFSLAKIALLTAISRCCATWTAVQIQLPAMRASGIKASGSAMGNCRKTYVTTRSQRWRLAGDSFFGGLHKQRTLSASSCITRNLCSYYTPGVRKHVDSPDPHVVLPSVFIGCPSDVGSQVCSESDCLIVSEINRQVWYFNEKNIREKNI